MGVCVRGGGECGRREKSLKSSSSIFLYIVKFLLNFFCGLVCMIHEHETSIFFEYSALLSQRSKPWYACLVQKEHQINK